MFVLNDAAFQEMIAKGKAQGTLTYEEVSSFLPDEIEGTDRIDFSRKVVEEQNLDTGMHRGFGMYLISALVDDYEVSSSQHGTVMTLRLYRKEHSHE